MTATEPRPGIPLPPPSRAEQRELADTVLADLRARIPELRAAGDVGESVGDLLVYLDEMMTDGCELPAAWRRHRPEER